MFFSQYINGKLVEGLGKLLEVLNPATGKLIAAVPTASVEQVEEALQGAADAFVSWSKTSITQREAYIQKLIDVFMENEKLIVDTLIEETGKSADVASYDFHMLPDCLHYFIEEVKRLNGEMISDYDNGHMNLMVRKPLGVVACHLAWNYPLLNVGYKMGPILASGCTCVLKPSSDTPLTTMLVGELIAKAGLPAGVVNVVVGSGNVISRTMNESVIPSMITLIGSTDTGRKIIEQSATSVKHFSLEMGGSAPVVVMKDADAYAAGKYTADGKTGNSGQVCVAPNRVFVHKDALDEFLRGVNEYLDQVIYGTGYTTGGNLIGPLVNARAVERMEALVQDAVEKGAKVLRGGRRHGTEGFYFEPTVLLNVTPDMRVYQEEIFGPIMPVMTFDDSADVKVLANDTQYGLAAYVYTRDLNTALDLGTGIDSGSVCVNEPFYAYQLPHGGCKQSGIGKDCSHFSLEEYFTVQRISIKL